MVFFVSPCTQEYTVDTLVVLAVVTFFKIDDRLACVLSGHILFAFEQRKKEVTPRVKNGATEAPTSAFGDQHSLASSRFWLTSLQRNDHPIFVD